MQRSVNPVAAKLVSRPEDWPHSNYLEWIGKRPGVLIDRAFVLEYYPRPRDYEDFMRATIDEALGLKLVRYYLE